MKKSVKSLFILAVVLLAAGGWYYQWRKGMRLAALPTYDTVAVGRGDLKQTIQATGTVLPENRLEIKPPIAGRIDEVRIAEGKAVKKGQIIALMSSTDRAALMDLARAKGQADVNQLMDVYRATPIVAPLGGQVIAKNIEVGQTVSATDTVFVLSDHLVVVAQVDETDLGRIEDGQSVEFSLDAFPAERIRGKVIRIAYEAKTVSNVTVYEVRILPDVASPHLRSGMTASVLFKVDERENVLTLPVSALSRDNDGYYAQEAPTHPEATPGQRRLETGLSDGKNMEIVSGAKEGDSFVIPRVVSKGNSGSTNPFMPTRPSRGTKKPGAGASHP